MITTLKKLKIRKIFFGIVKSDWGKFFVNKKNKKICGTAKNNTNLDQNMAGKNTGCSEK